MSSSAKITIPCGFRAELERAILHRELRDITDALDRLKKAGVVCVAGELVCASPWVLHLHERHVLVDQLAALRQVGRGGR